MKANVEFKKTIKKRDGGYEALSVAIEEELPTLNAVDDLIEEVKATVHKKLE